MTWELKNGEQTNDQSPSQELVIEQARAGEEGGGTGPNAGNQRVRRAKREETGESRSRWSGGLPLSECTDLWKLFCRPRRHLEGPLEEVSQIDSQPA